VKSWQSCVVLQGDRSAGKIGFPTINLDPYVLKKTKEGIYAALICYKKETYKGVLFYGPRLVKGEKENVLEIHILNFNENLYGKIVKFQIKDFIRKVRNFTTEKELVKQIKVDVKMASKSLNRLI